MGRVIKIPIKTGTVLDLNQNKVNKIKETTGVAFIKAKGNLKKFSIPRFMQESNPIEREKNRERKKAKRLLRIVAKSTFLKLDSVSNVKNLLKTKPGAGNTSSESIFILKIFQKIIITHNGKIIIWKKSFIFCLCFNFDFKFINQSKIYYLEVFHRLLLEQNLRKLKANFRFWLLNLFRK